MDLLNDYTFSIRFFLYEYGRIERDAYNVYARIIYKRNSVNLSVKGMRAKPEEWDFENNLFLPDKAHHRYNNNKLLTIKDNLQKIYSELKDGEGYISVKTLRKMFRGETAEHSSMKFMEYFDLYINECRSRPAEYGAGVIEHYMKTRRHLMNYMAKKDISDIPLSALNRRFIIGFQDHLLSTNIEGKNRPMNANTATTYLRKLKAAVNKAVMKELLDRNPFNGYRLPVFKKKKPVFLTDSEIAAIRQLDFRGESRGLEIARDIFVFSIFTGVRWIDATRLTKDHFRMDCDGVTWMRIEQQKTRQVLEVPVLAPAVEVIKKWKEQTKGIPFILPRLSHQRQNMYLKVIADLCGISGDKTLTFHVARHTFATTICLNNNVDIKVVSFVLGHTSVQHTEVYGHTTQKRLVEMMKEVDRKLLHETQPEKKVEAKDLTLHLN